MTATKAKPAKKPKPVYQPTKMPGGIPRLVQIWEDLRARNSDGYLAGVGGILANLKNHGSLVVGRSSTCSPFTATCIGVAFDPTYPRTDWPQWQTEVVMKSKDGADPYQPMFDGGTKPLHYATFHVAHNENDNAVQSLVDFGLGTAVDPKQMRRGDVVEINWWHGGGHAVFCWDVHLDANGDVDAFQILGANGPKPGVSIWNCGGKPWLEGENASRRGTGTLKKLRDKIFVDDDDVVRQGAWLVLPGVTKVDLDTFRVKPRLVLYSKKGANFGITARTVRCGRLNYDGDPPPPKCMRDGKAPPPAKPGHTDAPTTSVRGKGVKSDPATLQQVEPKPVQQEKDKPTRFQLEVEQAMAELFLAQWIEVDPGKPDGINDAKTQAAVKDYQGKLHLQVDGIAGNETRGSLQKQLPACRRQAQVQEQLRRLHAGGRIASDPGPVDGKNNPSTKAAVQDFQRLVELEPSGIPDADTQAKLTEYMAAQAATAEKPGLEPVMQHLYWVGNRASPNGSATLRLHHKDLIVGQACAIELRDEASGQEAKATLPILILGTTAEAVVTVPPQFGAGARLLARVTADIADEGTLEANTPAPLYVVGAGTEPVDWRPFIGKDELPAALCEAIARNRGRYPLKKFTAARGGPNNAYAGPHKWDYKPPKAHGDWARGHFAQKLDNVAPAQRNALRAFLLMLAAEGRPASMQTYDNQIVTWGVGLGAKGDGVHAFERLNRDPAMRRLLDDLGVNYFDGDYHVVDLRSRKVVSSAAGKKGNDNRHVVALEAWRQQLDLLSAIIGISEDPATRVQVAESQYAVYLSNSASWPGQDKVFTLALYFMIAHMYHWLPAIAKRGFDVGQLFAAAGGGMPSLATDKAIALPIAQGFAKKAGEWFAKRPAAATDVRTRTKTRLWKKLVEDGKKEGFDPGEFSYAD